ncbi:MAG: hypothetical protein HYZ38_06620 [Mycobacterium sp.]|nr:hypothetical protein [Mycobacterium sp.]
MSEPEAPKKGGRNLAKTLISLVWIYGGRGVGMLWTLALIAQLSISDYGLYSMAFALMSIVGPALNNPYAVRALRESEDRFLGERAGRYLLGVAILLIGQLFINVNYIAWFGLTTAGGELVMKAYLSRANRDGHPDRSFRMDTIRQMSSVALGSIYLFSTDHPKLLVASIVYCLPYAVVIVITGFVVRGHRPKAPGSPKLMALLAGEMLGTALYLQGDVLLLGWMTSHATAGYYSLTWTVASAIATVGMSYSGTYVESLREHDGDVSAGPPLKNTLTLAAVGGSLVLLTGIGLLISPAPTELAVAMMIMSIYCAVRTTILVFQTILYTQRRDVFRFGVAVGLVPFKLLAVAALAAWAGLGAVGGAIATAGTDAVLLAIFATALYGKRLARKTAEDPA